MEIPKGKLIAIGGSEDKGTEEEVVLLQQLTLDFFQPEILNRIVTEIKGVNSHIEIVTTASSIPEEVAKNYIEAFEKLGCKDVGVIHIRSRDDAQMPEYIEKIKKTDGVMFTGGNQLKLSTILGGTGFLECLQRKYMEEDFVIAGTSAGAMAMSNTMIYQGSSSEALLKGEVKLTTGLAFIKDVIFDSHFVKRGRFGRLMQTVVSNPSCIGIGLGENTGMLITNGSQMEAIGSGLVVIVDGRDIKYTNITQINEGKPISIENLTIHVLVKGNVYDLKERSFGSSNQKEEENLKMC